MRQLILLLLVFCFISSSANAQFARYVVKLRNKDGGAQTLNNPSAYLSQRAIERRTRYSIAIDSSDLPIPSTYIAQILSIPNLTLLNQSKWLNAVSIQTTDAAAIAALNALPFVESVKGVAARSGRQRKDPYEDETDYIRVRRSQNEMADYFNYGHNSLSEIHLHNGEFLHNVGLRGQGMQIAMLDGGFYHYNSLKAFDSVNINGQVLGTWDFVARDASVIEDNTHGMMCLSTIAANIPGQFIGKSPKASFYLFRTEDVSSEFPIEEFNWAAGAERADSSGADVISSSLGYGYEFSSPVADYPYSDLNGDITMSARAADMAAAKGLIVFNSAGNSGNDYWRMIITPADGDSVVAVGAVDVNGLVGSFSSYGPSTDGRVKPDIASVGVAAMVQTAGNTLGTANGTSFACPNMAGLGTCLWQGFPEFNNMRIIRALKEAGSIANAPDNRMGYGIPDLRKAFKKLLSDFATSAAELNGCNASITWTSKDVHAMRYELERKAPGDAGFSKIADLETASGDLLQNHSYQFTSTLNNVPSGIVSYRIKQIFDTTDLQNSFIYIDTLQVNLTTNCVGQGGPAIRIAPTPTPAGSVARIMIETPNSIDQLMIYVYDMKGAMVIKYNRFKGPGLATIELPSTKLAKGKYIVQVYDGKQAIGRSEMLIL